MSYCERMNIRNRQTEVDRIRFVLLFLSYFVGRIIFLTNLAIFNDEAIYLHWGLISVTVPGQLFYSLFDGKQPGLMWLFGIAQGLLPNSIVAGRLVSIAFGGVTLMGVLWLSRLLMPKLKQWWLAGVVYIVSPWFYFYDRQALMESAMVAVTVFSIIFVIKSLQTKQCRWFVVLGALLAVGFWIKTTAVLVAVAVGCVVLVDAIFTQSRRIHFEGLGLMVTTAIVCVAPLLLQPSASNIFSMNARFSLTLGELVRLPLATWGTNALAFVSHYGWWLGPPFVLLLCFNFASFIRQRRQGIRGELLLWLYWILLSMGYIVATRTPYSRYLVAMVAPVAVLLVMGVARSKQRFASIFFWLGVSWCLGASALLAVAPQQFFHLNRLATRFNDYAAYVSDWTAGWAVTEAVQWMRNNVSADQQIRVAVREDFGNPEDTVFLLLRGDGQFVPTYLSQVAIDQDEQGCIQFRRPTVFVTRGSQLGSVPELWKELRRFYNPDGETYVGVYQGQNLCMEDG